MSDVPNIKLCRVDDWQALYVGDKLIAQDHKIDIETVVNAINSVIGDKFVKFSQVWCNDHEIEQLGGFPANFSDIENK